MDLTHPSVPVVWRELRVMSSSLSVDCGGVSKCCEPGFPIRGWCKGIGMMAFCKGSKGDRGGMCTFNHIRGYSGANSRDVRVAAASRSLLKQYAGSTACVGYQFTAETGLPNSPFYSIIVSKTARSVYAGPVE